MSVLRRIVVLISAGLLVAGCFPILSKNPIGNKRNDSRLVGVWVHAEDPEEMRVDFKRTGMGRLSMVMAPKGETPSHFNVITSKVGGKRFMSAMMSFPKWFIDDWAEAEGISRAEAKEKIAEMDPQMYGYYLAEYHFDEDGGLKISLMMIDSDAIEAAMEDGRLSYEIITVKEGGSEDEMPRLTNSTKSLTRFVKNHNGVEYFELEFLDLVRPE